MTQTEIAARWIAGLRWEDIPKRVINQAKICLMDHLACAAGGAQSEPGRIATHLAVSWGGPQDATVLGKAQKVAARHAAFANATMANALDYDDTFHGHPGATTFPTALAGAEKWQATGQDFLLAAIIGYEFSFRAMALMKPLIPRYRAMWDLGTLQAYGAGAAAARLAGLDAKAIANVLGIISGTAPVPLPRKQRFDGEGRSMLKSAYGWAADAAITATELTLAGFSGPGHALDNNLGFYEVQPLPERGIENFTDGLGSDWAILDVEFKPFMACRFIHPVLQAVETIMSRRPLLAEAVQQVEIESFSLLADEHHYILRPVSGTDAQFSVPYTVAAMITNGRLSPDSYEKKALNNARILSLADRVHVNVDERFDKAYPKQLGARVRIFLDDGFSETVEVDHPRGSASQPITEQELRHKFHHLVDPLLGSDRAEAAVQEIHRVDELKSVESLIRLFAVQDPVLRF